MTATKQLLSKEEKSRISLYPEHDFIPFLEPDPPYVRIPPQNEKFLARYFTPVFDTHTCPFCRSKVQQNSLGSRTWVSKMQAVFKEWRVISERGDARLYVCPSCSWWAVLQTDLGRQVIEEKNYACLIDLVVVYWAKMKTFEVAANEASLAYLRTFLAQNTNEISQNSPNQLVDVIQSCFGGFFDCQVTQVGEAITDPYETFLVKAEKPLLIRIKRKDLANHDGVQVIHDVLGVMLVENEFTGLLVGLANRFSEDLERTAMLPVIQEEGITIPLTDYEAVLEIVKRPIHDSAKPWDMIW
jgi:hypothetical protein